MSGSRENLIVGLDIGTTKICAVVGNVTSEGVDIIGIGTSASHGIRKGVVINIESTVAAVRKAVSEAELMAGCEIKNVYAGVSGAHIKGTNSQGVIAIKNREVSTEDMERVIEAAKAIPKGPESEIVHILPQEFLIDDQDGIREPLGMSGVRLEAKVHIVTGSTAGTQNITKSCSRANLQVADIVLGQLASAQAVLSEDEKELGVVVIDIGGGTTDLAIFVNGAIVHTAVLPLGGNHLTNDIAVGLRTPMGEAERIKIKYGCCLSALIGEDETIEVPSVGGRKPRTLSRRILAEILEPRVEEIFELVNKEIRKSGVVDLLASGVVITGGTAILEGVPELAEEIFKLPVRRGVPCAVGGLCGAADSPIYSTAVGLVLYGSKQHELVPETSVKQSVGKGWWQKLKEWIQEFF